jgi:hypothetical protein
MRRAVSAARSRCGDPVVHGEPSRFDDITPEEHKRRADAADESCGASLGRRVQGDG